MTNQRAIILLSQMYLPCFDEEEKEAITRAIEALTAQEPRLVTEADFDGADEYGYLPVWIEYKDDSEIICGCTTKIAITYPDGDYYCRFWTSRPTKEQREAIPWE